jgi:hypothetical protein
MHTLRRGSGVAGPGRVFADGLVVVWGVRGTDFFQGAPGGRIVKKNKKKKVGPSVSGVG